MVQVNRVCLNIIFINRPQFLVDSNVFLCKVSAFSPNNQNIRLILWHLPQNEPSNLERHVKEWWMGETLTTNPSTLTQKSYLPSMMLITALTSLMSTVPSPVTSPFTGCGASGFLPTKFTLMFCSSGAK